MKTPREGTRSSSPEWSRVFDRILDSYWPDDDAIRTRLFSPRLREALRDADVDSRELGRALKAIHFTANWHSGPRIRALVQRRKRAQDALERFRKSTGQLIACVSARAMQPDPFGYDPSGIGKLKRALSVADRRFNTLPHFWGDWVPLFDDAGRRIDINSVLGRPRTPPNRPPEDWQPWARHLLRKLGIKAKDADRAVSAITRDVRRPGYFAPGVRRLP